MPPPKTLPDRLTIRFGNDEDAALLRGVYAYEEFSDVTPSRLIKRAIERELDRLARSDSKLKTKLEKAMKNGPTTRNY